jgi:hypothetical protein
MAALRDRHVGDHCQTPSNRGLCVSLSVHQDFVAMIAKDNNRISVKILRDNKILRDIGQDTPPTATDQP